MMSNEIIDSKSIVEIPVKIGLVPSDRERTVAKSHFCVAQMIYVTDDSIPLLADEEWEPREVNDGSWYGVLIKIDYDLQKCVAKLEPPLTTISSGPPFKWEY